MEFLNQLLGSHAIEVWGAGLVWSFIGIIAVKLWHIRKGVEFNFKFWVNDNTIDVAKGMFWALVILRLGDTAIHLAKEKFGFDFPETTDFVIFMLIISGLIQLRLHKNRKAISKDLKDKMHKHNENCKH